MTWAGFEATTGLDMEKIPFTQVGLDRLKEELNSLKHTERQAVIKAIAAGAKACSFGKGYLFSLSAGGQKGVEKMLQNMHNEIKRNMKLMGCKNLKELNSSKLAYR